MQEGRYFPVGKKIKIVFNKSFPIYKELNVGDRQMIKIDGIVEGEKMGDETNGAEFYTKTIRILTADLAGEKSIRRQ